MVGIRIRRLPDQCLEKVLKIYFSKPENGGGKIKKIYHPLMNNDAVIVFEDQKVLQTITQFHHKMGGSDLEIEVLPEHMIFSTMEAKVDMNASIILQVSQKLRDEMEFGESIVITENEDQTYSLKGNWFQLEWAWNYLSWYMKHQEVIASQIEHTSTSQDPYAVSMETSASQSKPVAMETNDMNDDKWKTYRARPSSPTEVNTVLRKNISDRAKVEESIRSGSRSTTDQIRSTPHTSMSAGERSITKSHQSEMDERRSSREEPLLYHKSIGSPHESFRDTISPHSSLRQSPSPHVVGSGAMSRNEGGSLAGLRENISASYGAGSLSRHDPDDYDTGDEIEQFRGQEHVVPFESVHSSLGIGNQVRRSDENKTFEHFSGMSSLSGPRRSPSPVAVTRPSSASVSSSAHMVEKKESSSVETTPTKISRDSFDKAMAALGPYIDNLKDGSMQGATAASPRSLKESRTKVDISPTTGSYLTRSQSKLPDRYSNDQLQGQFTIKHIVVTVYFGDLLQETADGIVNASNSDLDNMGGVAYAIAQARGPEIGRECREYIRRNGNLKVSDVTHTSGGGKLKATHILHAFGPMWLGEESRERSANQLRDTFLNCFKYAEKKLWIRSLSTPAISTGVFGVPLDVCVRSFLDAVLIFIDKQEDGRLMDIRLVSNDAESTVTSIVLLQTLLEAGIDNLTAEASESYRKFHEKSTMNLPRGRPETTDFSRSFMSPSLTSSGMSHHRRSSSTSRMSDRRRTEDESGSVSKFDRQTNSYVDKDLTAKKSEERGRSRTHSATDKQSPRDYDHGIGRPTSGAGTGKSYTTSAGTGKSYTTSAGTGKSYTNGEASQRRVPVIKQSLLAGSSSKLSSRKTPSTTSTKTPTRSRTSALKVGDEDYRSRRSPVSDTYDDSYSYKSPGRSYLEDKEDEFGMQSLPVDLGRHDSSFREKFLQLQTDEKTDRKVNLCAICLDKVRKPKSLSKCGHTFCTGCIDEYFASSKPKCPTCGQLYGQLKGDQPKGGNMTYSMDRSLVIPGYEREDGAIVINYSFPGGIQESCHPRPGMSYKGISRKAYLPNSAEGREVLRLLKKAFQAKLMFTIGDSRTSGHSGVITWNDIHHKTSVTGGSSKFGYPDSTYLKRVKEELARAGIQ